MDTNDKRKVLVTAKKSKISMERDSSDLITQTRTSPKKKDKL